MKRLDAHVHVFNYTAHPDHFPWMSDELALMRRDYLLDDVKPLLAEAAMDGIVLVEAREMAVETDFLLGLAADPVVHGVVGWVDLCAPDIEARLDTHANAAKLKGYRMLIQDQADLDFASSQAHVHGVRCLTSRDLTYDLLLHPKHIPAALRLIDQCPRQRFVVDHIGQPEMDGGDRVEWQKLVGALAARPDVYCKLSGMLMLAEWHHWRAETFFPFLDFLCETFGPGRLMFGSNWPVCDLSGSYGQALDVVERWARRLSETERADIMGGTCARFYRL